MPVSKKTTKKPKLKIKTKQKQKQKQSVNVNVTIDQSKKGRSGGGGSAPRVSQPNIINFPSNTPVSEIRYNVPEIKNPVSVDPTKLHDPEKVINAPLTLVEKPKMYINPNRPIVTDSSLLGAVADVGLQVGSSALKEAYPEYSELVDVGGQAVDYLGKKFVSGDIQKAGEGLTKGISKGYNYLFGKKKDSSTSIDAWDTLSNTNVSTDGNLLASIPSTISKNGSKNSIESNNNYPSLALPNKSDSIQSNLSQLTSNGESKQSSKTSKSLPKPLPRRVTIEGGINNSEPKITNPLARRVTMDDNFSNYTFNSQFSGVNPLIEQTPIPNKIFSSSKKDKPSSSSKGTPIINHLFEGDNGYETEVFVDTHLPEGVGRPMNTETQVSPFMSKTLYQKFQSSIKGQGHSREDIKNMWLNHPDNKKQEQKNEIRERKDMGENDDKKKKKGGKK